ncbi:MAG: DUF2065 domain-containing protein [Nevskiaceae bacterium]|nr:MAG: DUF2065 domain-containing protein [Nevskiaceae bacterium]TBR74632.1 MAG: DUF2065 domain-containing protein [Nevskiaceae bacterium]
MWADILRALALVLVLEGLMPFLVPQRFREAMARLQGLDDRALRTVGFVCLLVGVLVLELIRWLG